MQHCQSFCHGKQYNRLRCQSWSTVWLALVGHDSLVPVLEIGISYATTMTKIWLLVGLQMMCPFAKLTSRSALIRYNSPQWFCNWRFFLLFYMFLMHSVYLTHWDLPLIVPVIILLLVVLQGMIVGAMIIVGIYVDSTVWLALVGHGTLVPVLEIGASYAMTVTKIWLVVVLVNDVSICKVDFKKCIIFIWLHFLWITTKLC